MNSFPFNCILNNVLFLIMDIISIECNIIIKIQDVIRQKLFYNIEILKMFSGTKIFKIFVKMLFSIYLNRISTPKI